VLDSDRSSFSAACDETASRAAGGLPPARDRRRAWRLFGRALPAGDDGMTTAEYAVGTVAACGFAGVLWAVVHSSTVAHLLSGVVARALQTTF
jgi:uncharacterized protein DUF4244